MGSKITDALIIAVVLVTAVKVYGPLWRPEYTVAMLVATIAFFLIDEVVGLYHPWRGETITCQFFQILFVWLGTFFVLLLLAYAFKSSSVYSRVSIGMWLVVTPFLLSTWRVLGKEVFSHYARRKGRKSRVVVWGNGELCEQLVERISQSSWLGLHLVEHIQDEVTDSPVADAPDPRTDPTNSKLDDLIRRARNGDFDILYVGLPTGTGAGIAELINRLADSTVSLYLVPDYFTSSLAHGKWSNLEGILLVNIYDTPLLGCRRLGQTGRG